MRKDRLIHFLRVQIHVESNNTNVELTRKIIEYWYDGNKEPLQEILPEDLYAALDRDSEWYPKARKALRKLCGALSMSLSDLFRLNAEKVECLARSVFPNPNIHETKVSDIFQIHALLLEKYSFESEDVLSLVENARIFKKADLEALRDELQSNRSDRAVCVLYKMMNQLKGVILKSEKTEAFEIIQYKRHIAAGIPSTYGQYMEPKFEALGLMYRLERVVTRLISQVLQPLSQEYITAKTLRQIYHVLLLFKEGLALDGIYDQGLSSHLDMFKYSRTSPSFSLRSISISSNFLAQDVSNHPG
jgi:pyruvate,orthophosphate dikinase